ncbi:MAG TPA: VOC family protein [Xanthobacteraceae bacterium]|nr:VOC family protein [Xanthobacteraceae bacterium]
MAIPQTNFKPPFNITRASHLTLTAQDLPASRAFYTEVIGLMVAAEDANTLWLRGVEERQHHSLTLKKTSADPACEAIGMHVFDEEDLDRAKSHFDRIGLAAKFIEVPFQGRTLRYSDNMGTVVDLVATMKSQPRNHVAVNTHKGARALRFDHYQVLVPDVNKAAQFYCDLGFRISDYIVVENTDFNVGIFLYRKDNPWDLVFLHRRGPQFHHCGYVVESMFDLIRGLDCAGNVGFAECIEHGPGRHGHGHAYYTYLRDPDGHRTELLLPAIQIVDRYDEPVACPVAPNSVGNRWGFPPPKSWFEEAAPFIGAKIVAPPHEGDPLTLEKYLGAKSWRRAGANLRKTA